jgi:hypothetical protein
MQELDNCWSEGAVNSWGKPDCVRRLCQHGSSDALRRQSECENSTTYRSEIAPPAAFHINLPPADFGQELESRIHPLCSGAVRNPLAIINQSAGEGELPKALGQEGGFGSNRAMAIRSTITTTDNDDQSSAPPNRLDSEALSFDSPSTRSSGPTSGGCFSPARR